MSAEQSRELVAEIEREAGREWEQRLQQAHADFEERLAQERSVRGSDRAMSSRATRPFVAPCLELSLPAARAARASLPLTPVVPPVPCRSSLSARASCAPSYGT